MSSTQCGACDSPAAGGGPVAGGATAAASVAAQSPRSGSTEPDFPAFQRFHGRGRSQVYAKHGMVASSQPLATEAGLRILRAGGNAVDAAVAVAAALNVTEPTSTGIGGDCFALYYDAATKSVSALNGSGRCPKALTLERALRDYGARANLADPNSYMFDAHTVTVPGAAAGWVDAISKWGTMTMEQVLAPAIELAEDGFPVSPVTAFAWHRGKHLLVRGPHAHELLIDGEAPRAGQLFKNPTLGKTFRTLAAEGKRGFYEGRIAEALVKVAQQSGSVISLEDLAAHESTFPDPIHVNYRGVDVFEVPPNGQGITALLALNLLNHLDVSAHPFHSAGHLHSLIEAMRIAFADTRWYVADTSKVHVPVSELLSIAYSKQRLQLFNPAKAAIDAKQGSPVTSCDTVSFQVVDQWGNACSFINSNYCGFGTGLIPEGCGFTLQNRGHNFSLDADHPNCLAPGKRPYHTIIPGMALKDGHLFASFSVMGGFMQPQGHVQVLSNMIDYGMDPQTALDAPRFCIKDGTAGGAVALEDGIDPAVVAQLAAMGHDVTLTKDYERFLFGRGQIISRDPSSGVLCGGSDGRADGCAFGF